MDWASFSCSEGQTHYLEEHLVLLWPASKRQQGHAMRSAVAEFLPCRSRPRNQLHHPATLRHLSPSLAAQYTAALRASRAAQQRPGVVLF